MEPLLRNQPSSCFSSDACQCWSKQQVGSQTFSWTASFSQWSMSKKQECPAETTFPQQNRWKYPLGSNSAVKTCRLACSPDFVSFHTNILTIHPCYHYCQSKRNEWATRTPPSAPISAFPTSSTLRILGANRLFVGHYWLLHSATDCSSGGCKKFARAVKVGARLSKTRLWGWFRCKK